MKFDILLNLTELIKTNLPVHFLKKNSVFNYLWWTISLFRISHTNQKHLI